MTNNLHSSILFSSATLIPVYHTPSPTNQITRSRYIVALICIFQASLYTNSYDHITGSIS